MKKVDWGFRIGGNGNVNMIHHVDPDPERPQARRYWTGGTSSGSKPMTKWPDKEISRVRHDNVTVRFHAFADAELAEADDRAISIARIVSAAVSIWPGPDTRVEVDAHLVPADVSYQYARLITWQEGMPFLLTLFIPAGSPRGDLNTAETAAHELFHVMNGILGRGAIPATPDSDPDLLNMTNEVFAEVFAACGTLLANGERKILPTNNSITVDGRKYQGYLTRAEIHEFFERYADTHIIKYAGPIMAGSAFRELYGGEALMRADDPAGQRMLALCARIAPDHGRLADWLLTLDP